jgi:hypothetical protein
LGALGHVPWNWPAGGVEEEDVDEDDEEEEDEEELDEPSALMMILWMMSVRFNCCSLILGPCSRLRTKVLWVLAREMDMAGEQGDADGDGGQGHGNDGHPSGLVGVLSAESLRSALNFL